MRKTARTFMIIGSLALSLVMSAATEVGGVEADNKLAATIKEAVRKDTSLSVGSRNISVAVQNSAVTLQGSVKSDAETQFIIGKAESLILQQKGHDFNKPPQIRNQLKLIPSN
jgi:osmotically-inducible protein OsmY